MAFFFPVEGRGGGAAGCFFYAAGGHDFHGYRTGLDDFMGIKAYGGGSEEDGAFLGIGRQFSGALFQIG